MSDTIFLAFLLLALGIGLCQVLVAWELMLMHRLMRGSTVQRQAILDDHTEIRARQAEIKNRQDLILQAIARLEADRRP